MDHMKWQQSVSHSASDSDDDCSDSCRGSMAASSSSSANPGRKRRRGIIEKRRRDRINQSLAELKRLVPAALEKSNSAKLEKAEILQMTVEHLKMVQNNRGTGGNGYVDAYTAQQDAHKIAFDYHAIGFRECAAEVARYLGAVEGMEVPDPARVRLLTHLQMFATQKQSYGHAAHTAAAYSQMPMAAVNSQGWPSYGNHSSTPYTSSSYNYCDPPNKSSESNGTTILPNADSLRYTFPTQITSSISTNTTSTDSTTSTTLATGVPTASYNGQYSSYAGNPQTTSYFSAFGAPPPSAATAAAVAAAASQHSQQLHNHNQNNSVSSVSSSTSPASANHGSSLPGSTLVDGRVNGHDTLVANYLAQNKPYRPWGAEMASC